MPREHLNLPDWKQEKYEENSDVQFQDVMGVTCSKHDKIVFVIPESRRAQGTFMNNRILKK